MKVISPLETASPLLEPLLSVSNVSKRFSGVLANDRVSLALYPGEVHALLGENGAGKSTLVSILYGLLQPDAGELHMAGERVRFDSPKDAIARGVALVAQHFMLARRHSVVENLALSLATPWLFPTRKLGRDLSATAKHYGLMVDPHARVWQLSPGEQQRVEILRALMQQARVLILDEPTSVLTPQEAERLFRVVAQMKAEGKAVLFITHKLEEVMTIADRITVLRRGRVVGTLSPADTTPAQLATLMVGRAVTRHVSPVRAVRQNAGGERVLEVRDLWVTNDRGTDALKGVSFVLHRGEMMGVAGVAGNGQSELAAVLTGMRRATRGSVMLDGCDVTRQGVRERLEAGVAHIPEDRNHMGVVAQLSVAENLVLRQYRDAPFARGPLLDRAAIQRFATDAVKTYQVATPSLQTRVSRLSGGNVQKLILARELRGEPAVIVAAHPSYGLDVSATGLTHELLVAQRDRGAGVLLISEDLGELFSLCDRIAVMFAGRMVAILETDRADREGVGLMMAGVAA